MRLLAVVLIVLTRLVLVLPLLLLWWVVLLAKGLVLAIGDTAVFLIRLLIGGVLRPLGHRYALLLATIGVVIAGAYLPELQNPSFYVLLAGCLLACFLAGKFGGALLPKSAPDYSRTFPPLPGWPSWPPIPKTRPRVVKEKPPPEIFQKPRPEMATPVPTMPVRPASTPVSVMAAGGVIHSPSEAEAITALPEALQRLMRPKQGQPTGGSTAQEQAG